MSASGTFDILHGRLEEEGKHMMDKEGQLAKERRKQECMGGGQRKGGREDPKVQRRERER